ncbi:hypothetical protein [Pantoea sp.]|uniref:hypothetical protein n=1 Tax=Pantoea sp. TaxID=69393 RepID=UPI0028A9909C|nr:hypothetical protein [Pantoea sp.]
MAQKNSFFPSKKAAHGKKLSFRLINYFDLHQVEYMAINNLRNANTLTTNSNDTQPVMLKA